MSAAKNRNCSFLRHEQVLKERTDPDEKKANNRETKFDNKETIFLAVKKELVHFYHMNNFTEEEQALMRKNKH